MIKFFPANIETETGTKIKFMRGARSSYPAYAGSYVRSSPGTQNFEITAIDGFMIINFEIRTLLKFSSFVFFWIYKAKLDFCPLRERFAKFFEQKSCL